MALDAGLPDGQTLARARQSPRYEYIDALRGLAALAVLYLHAAGSVKAGNLVHNDLEATIIKALTEVVDVGQIGVIVFFAISGFVIPISLTKRNSSAAGFVLSRFFRLYPAYWLSIVMALYFIYYQHSYSIGFPTIALNLTMLQQFFMYPNIIGLYWTLQIELVFYAICLLMFLLGMLQRDDRLFLVAIGFLMLAVVFALIRFETHQKVPIALPLALSIMFWGSLLRSGQIDHNIRARQYVNVLTVLILAAMPPISLLGYNFDAGFGETWSRYTADYTIAIGLFYLMTGRYRISGALFSWLGRISYSVYLFHPVFVSIASDYVFKRLPALSIAHLYVAIVAAMAVAFAHISYKFVEAPFIALGKAIVGSWQPGFPRQRAGEIS